MSFPAQINSRHIGAVVHGASMNRFGGPCTPLMIVGGSGQSAIVVPVVQDGPGPAMVTSLFHTPGGGSGFHFPDECPYGG